MQTRELVRHMIEKGERWKADKAAVKQVSPYTDQYMSGICESREDDEQREKEKNIRTLPAFDSRRVHCDCGFPIREIAARAAPVVLILQINIQMNPNQ